MGRHAIDLLGERFGHLLVTAPAGRSPTGHVQWKCRCDCGNDNYVVLSQSLRTGKTIRCNVCRMASATSATSAARQTRQRPLPPHLRPPAQTMNIVHPSPQVTPTITLEVWLKAVGKDGGFAVAKDAATGQTLAHSPQVKQYMRSMFGYPPVLAVLQWLITTGRLPVKDDQWDRWARRNGVRVILGDGTRLAAAFDEQWAQAAATGTLVPAHTRKARKMSAKAKLAKLDVIQQAELAELDKRNAAMNALLNDPSWGGGDPS